MARDHANSGRVYRAVIAKTFRNGRVTTSTYGPYDTAAPAKGLITRAEYESLASHGEYRNPDCAFTVSAHVETAEVIWKEVSK